jgi:hypothetical protein
MNKKVHRGFSLLETVLAATIGAALLVPMTMMLISATGSHRRSEVTTAMRLQAEQSIDLVRSSVASPADFDRVAGGGFPTGLRSDQLVTVLPGEIVRQRINVSAADRRRDLLTLDITLTHDGSGATKRANPMRVVTQIARPW